MQQAREGQRVRIVNLQNKKELNGAVGVVEKILANGRYRIKVTTSSDLKYFSINPENLRTFEDTLVQFVVNTVIGIESALYKKLGGQKVLELHIVIGGSFIADYLNQCYKSLILKNDNYVLEKFAEMQSFHHHSEVCLLHIILEGCMGIFQTIDNTKFDISTYSNFMKSAEKHFQELLEPMRQVFSQKLYHQCTGHSIDGEDPEKPLFILGDGKSHPDVKAVRSFILSPQGVSPKQ